MGGLAVLVNGRLLLQNKVANSLSVTKAYSGQASKNTSNAAKRTLIAGNSNSFTDEPIDLEVVDQTAMAVGENSGSNTGDDNAFAAYAGILHQAWDSNSQRRNCIISA